MLVDVPDAPVQFQANNLAYDDYVGRIAIGRVHAGSLLAGGQAHRDLTTYASLSVSVRLGYRP